MLLKKGYIETIRDRIVKLLKKSGKNKYNRYITQDINTSKDNNLLKPLIIDSDVKDIIIKKYIASGANGIVFLNSINLQSLFPHLSGTMKAITKTEVEGHPSGDKLDYEFKVSLVLNQLRQFVPNFMFTYGVIRCMSNISQYSDDYLNNKNVNKPVCEKNGKRLKLFTISEYSGDITFRDYIHQSLKYAKALKGSNRTIAMDAFMIEIVHLYCQILSAMAIAYNRMGIVHNDLHGGNVLVRNCCYKPGHYNRYIYNLGKDRIITYSKVMPTVIDFGRVSMNKSVLKKYGFKTGEWCVIEKNRHMCKANDVVDTNIMVKNRTRDIVLLTAHILKKVHSYFSKYCSDYYKEWYKEWANLFYLNYPDILEKKRGEYIGYSIHDISSLPRNHKYCITGSKDVVMFFKPFLEETGKLLKNPQMESFEYNKKPKMDGYESELKGRKKYCANRSKSILNSFKRHYTKHHKI
jgi:hypothetical protein